MSMARSAALKLVGNVIDPSTEVDEPSMFISTLVRRSSVASPRT
jgi:LacI family transcriptional regulator